MSCQKTRLTTSNNLVAYLKRKVKQTKARRLVWVCKCGCVIPKKGAELSGDPSYKCGFHVHCPKCGRVVSEWVNPKETR